VYKDQFWKLIEERALHERAIGELNVRIEHALLMFAAIEEAVPKKPLRVVASDNAPYGSLRDSLYEIVTAPEVDPKRGIEFFDIMAALRRVGIDAKTDTVRATIAKLVELGKIRRVSRGSYGALKGKVDEKTA
jgi:hypothetical protein